jgi:hypothetical protein
MNAPSDRAYAVRRVARWYIFEPKISIWVYFGGPALEWKVFVYYIGVCNNLQPFGAIYGHLVHFMAIWYILWSFGKSSPVLVYCVKKYLAILAILRRHLVSSLNRVPD